MRKSINKYIFEFISFNWMDVLFLSDFGPINNVISLLFWILNLMINKFKANEKFKYGFYWKSNATWYRWRRLYTWNIFPWLKNQTDAQNWTLKSMGWFFSSFNWNGFNSLHLFLSSFASTQKWWFNPIKVSIFSLCFQSVLKVSYRLIAALQFKSLFQSTFGIFSKLEPFWSTSTGYDKKRLVEKKVPKNKKHRTQQWVIC